MLANRVREYSTTTGTGDVTLGGAIAGYNRFADMFSVGERTIYVIEDGINYEIGTGTLVDTDTLARTSISETLVDGVHTTNGAAPIPLKGSARIYCAATADFLPRTDMAVDSLTEATMDAGIQVEDLTVKDSSLAVDGDFTLASGGTPVLQWDSSGKTWDFQHTEVKNTASIVRKLSTSALFLSGGSDKDKGANMQLYSEDHSTSANDLIFRVGTATQLHFDYSSALYNFYDNALAGISNLTMSGVLKTDSEIKINGEIDTFRTLQFSTAALARWKFVVNAASESGSNTGSHFTIVRHDDSGEFISRPFIIYRDTGDIQLCDAANSAVVDINGTTGITSFTRDINLNGVQVRETNKIHLNKTYAQLYLAGGSDQNSGGNIVMYGEEHSTAANDLVLRSGTSIKALWDDSEDIWDFQQTALSNVASIVRKNTSSALFLSGGGDKDSGGNIVMYGDSHSTYANDITFRSGLSVKARWDDSENVWNFQGTELKSILSFSRGLSEGGLYLSGGTSKTTGANMLMYGEEHATNAYDIDIRTDTKIQLKYDYSAGVWGFQSNAIKGISDIEMFGGISGAVNVVRGYDADRLYISGGSSILSGANIVLQGENNATVPNNIAFRSGEEALLRWDDTGDYWDFHGKTVKSVGSIAVTNTLTVGGNITANGFFNVGASSTAEVLAGAITVVGTSTVVDTEGSASADDLDTINGGSSGDILYIRCNAASRPVTLKHDTGNIKLKDTTDVVLDSIYKSVTLLNVSGNWCQVD